MPIGPYTKLHKVLAGHDLQDVFNKMPCNRSYNNPCRIRVCRCVLEYPNTRNRLCFGLEQCVPHGLLHAYICKCSSLGLPYGSAKSTSHTCQRFNKRLRKGWGGHGSHGVAVNLATAMTTMTMTMLMATKMPTIMMMVTMATSNMMMMRLLTMTMMR